MEKHQMEQLKKLLLRVKANNEPNDIEMEESELSSLNNHLAESATDLMAMMTDMGHLQKLQRNAVRKFCLSV